VSIKERWSKVWNMWNQVRDNPGAHQGAEIMTEKQKEELLSAARIVSPGGVVKIPNGVSVREAQGVLFAADAISCKDSKGGHLIKSIDSQFELKPFTITSTVKLEATDARAAILKASQLLAEVAHGTLYEFEEFSVKVE